MTSTIGGSGGGGVEDLDGAALADAESAAALVGDGFGAVGGRGAQRGGGDFGAPLRAPGSVLPFYLVSGMYNTVLGPLSQNGIDMPPTRAEINTLESSCKEFGMTAASWNAFLTTDLATFNTLLAKNGLAPLKATAITASSSCTFAWPGRK